MTDVLAQETRLVDVMLPVILFFVTVYVLFRWASGGK